MRKVKDLVGRKFGRLTVVGFAGTDKRRNALWSCVCECGNVVVKNAKALTCGDTKSCGCLWKDVVIKHNMSGTPQYDAWRQAKDRVVNPKNKDWKDYGGRGIKMCDEWLNSASEFSRDMSPTWQEGLTLERKDVNGNYCPENCMWATESVQGHNKRKKRGCSSEYKGVCFHKQTGKFTSHIKINQKKEYLGIFVNELDAARAYDNRSEELYGDRPNVTEVVHNSTEKQEMEI